MAGRCFFAINTKPVSEIKPSRQPKQNTTLNLLCASFLNPLMRGNDSDSLGHWVI